jgi:hypothetical protein
LYQFLEMGMEMEKMMDYRTAKRKNSDLQMDSETEIYSVTGRVNLTGLRKNSDLQMDTDGLRDGDILGDWEGEFDGLTEKLGLTDGLRDGDILGDWEGEFDGLGEVLGDAEGELEGLELGISRRGLPLYGKARDTPATSSAHFLLSVAFDPPFTALSAARILLLHISSNSSSAPVLSVDRTVAPVSAPATCLSI